MTLVHGKYTSYNENNSTSHPYTYLAITFEFTSCVVDQVRQLYSRERLVVIIGN